MSQIMVCLKKYAKDSRMIYEVQLWTRIRLELQTRLNMFKNYKHGGFVRPTGR